MQTLRQIESINEFESDKAVLARFKADGTGETRIHVQGSTGNLFEHESWRETIQNARLLKADRTKCLDEILVLLDDGVIWDESLGTFE